MKYNYKANVKIEVTIPMTIDAYSEEEAKIKLHYTNWENVLPHGWKHDDSDFPRIENLEENMTNDFVKKIFDIAHKIVSTDTENLIFQHIGRKIVNKYYREIARDVWETADRTNWNNDDVSLAISRIIEKELKIY